jgi:hypothetical protein
MTHEQLVEAAKGAIQLVFGDTSVDSETTKASLEELKEELELLLDTL